MRPRGVRAAIACFAVFLALLALLAPRVAHAAAFVDLEVEPSNPEAGEMFRVRYTVRIRNESSAEATPLDFGGLELLSDPTPPQMPMMWGGGFGGGGFMMSIDTAREYVLRAPAPGRYAIGNARIVDQRTGRVIAQHANLTIVVGGSGGSVTIDAGATPSQSPPPPPADPDMPPLGDLTGAEYNPTAFIRVAVDNPHPYLGQQVILRAWLYTTSAETSCEVTREPGMTGFWSESLRPLSQDCAVRWTTQNVGGRYMSVGLVRKIALFPTQTGALAIGPIVANVIVMGGGIFRSMERYEAHSPGIAVDVREPPAAGRPANFVPGTSGPATLTAEIDRDTLAVGETTTITVRAASDGSLASARIAPPSHIDGVRIEAGTTRATHDTATGRVTSNMATEILVVPERPGTIDLGDVELPWWDPVAERYGVARVHLPTLTVTGTALTAEHIEQRPDPAMELRALNPAPELRPYRPLIPRGALALWILAAAPLALALGGVARTLGRRAADSAKSRAAELQQDPRAMLEQARALRETDAPRAVSLAGRALDRALAEAGGEAGVEALPERARASVREARAVSESARFAGGPVNAAEFVAAVDKALDALEADA